MRAYSRLAFIAGQELKGGILLLMSRWAFCGFNSDNFFFFWLFDKGRAAVNILDLSGFNFAAGR